MEAFELGVADFVAKPFTTERLAKAFERAWLRTGRERTRFLAVHVAEKIDLLCLDSVAAIHGEDDYSSIEMLDGTRHLHKKTLTALESTLPPCFLRVHRSHIVNMNCLTRLITLEGGGKAAVLTNGTQVPVGRTYTKELSARLIL